jgi:heme-degrading monooxygenase HmoA
MGGIKRVEGFLGQIGGWDKHKLNEAGIIAFWKDNGSYQKFMEHRHDEIFENSRQKNTYKNISINFFEKMFNISSTNITEFLTNGSILRTAECWVYTNKQPQFEQMQKEVWNKSMADSPGMLAGVFCNGQKENEMYLVASLWDNNHSHQWYVNHRLPTLIRSTGVKDLSKSITGNIIEINAKWCVI